jgi:hypothetical protein
MTDYDGLIARLESGSGADGEPDSDRFLPKEIAKAISGGDYDRQIELTVILRRAVAGSLDAALAFAEAVKSPIEQLQWVPEGVIANTNNWCGIGVDAPRAVLIATLRALLEQAR